MSIITELFGHPKEALNAELNRQKPKAVKAVQNAVGHAKAQGQENVSDVLKDTVVAEVKKLHIFSPASMLIEAGIALIPVQSQTLDAFLAEAVKRINGARF